MPYKPNYTDIRSTKIRDPNLVRTIDFQWDAVSIKAQYVLNQSSTTRPSDLFLVDGVLIKNNSLGTPVNIGIRPVGAAVPTDFFRIPANNQIFLKVNNLADLIYFTAQTVGQETISIIAS